MTGSFIWKLGRFSCPDIVRFLCCCFFFFFLFRLLIENPVQRLGATGAGEVCFISELFLIKVAVSIPGEYHCILLVLPGKKAPIFQRYQLGHTGYAEGFLLFLSITHYICFLPFDKFGILTIVLLSTGCIHTIMWTTWHKLFHEPLYLEFRGRKCSW